MSKKKSERKQISKEGPENARSSQEFKNRHLGSPDIIEDLRKATNAEKEHRKNTQEQKG